MALATRCPHCRTTFRVAHDQLKLRAGMVRCGSCQQIFNGIENLVPADAIAASAPNAAKSASAAPEPIAARPAHTYAPASATAHDTPAPAAIPLAAQSDESAHALPKGVPAALQDMHAEPSINAAPGNISPKAHQPETEPASRHLEAPEETVSELALSSDDLHFSIEEPASPTETPVQAEAEEELAEEAAIAPPQELAEEPAEAALDAAEMPPEELASGAASKSFTEPEESISEPAAEAEPTPAGPIDAPSDSIDAAEAAALEAQAELAAFLDEPEFVRRGRRKQRWGRIARIGMSISIFFLAIGLVLQSVYTFRNLLAVAYPQTKPWLTQGCALIACQVGLPAQIDTLSIEPNDRALLTLDKDKTLFEFNVLIRNHSSFPQAWPDIELTLNDGAGKAVVRRVFKARELPMPLQELGKGIAPNSEQSVKIFFKMTQLKASGYGVQIFYP